MSVAASSHAKHKRQSTEQQPYPQSQPQAVHRQAQAPSEFSNLKMSIDSSNSPSTESDSCPGWEHTFHSSQYERPYFVDPTIQLLSLSLKALPRYRCKEPPCCLSLPEKLHFPLWLCQEQTSVLSALRLQPKQNSMYERKLRVISTSVVETTMSESQWLSN
jgi:hypothetical protein